MSDNDRAVAEWQDIYKYTQGWDPIAGGYAEGEAFVVLYNPDKIMPFAVEFRKNRQFFTVLKDAVQYIRNQRWTVPEEILNE